jgi:hypothetical protein
MLIEDEHKQLICPHAVAIFDRCTADGAPDNRRLGSAGCWKYPDKAQKTCSKKEAQASQLLD